MAAGQPDAADSLEFAKMTKVQKLAALMIMIGPESASKMMQQFDEAEVEAVSGEMAKLKLLNHEIQAAVLKEFTDVAVTATTSLRGGLDYAQSTLEKALGMFKASNVLSRVAPSRTSVAAMQQITDLESRQIHNLIKTEQAQTIALILSYLPADKGSEVFAMLRSEARDQVIEKLALMAPTPIEVVETVVSILNQKLSGRQTRALSQTGGVKSAADLLNSIDKNLSKSLLISLEERNPELGTTIRQKMFTFEDLTMLETPSLQKIMREIDMRDLAVALKTSSEVLKKKLLGCISKRAAETVNEEMGFLGPLKLRDIEAAQMRVIEIVRRLESEGEIDLGEAKSQTADAVAA